MNKAGLRIPKGGFNHHTFHCKTWTQLTTGLSSRDGVTYTLWIWTSTPQNQQKWPAKVPTGLGGSLYLCSKTQHQNFQPLHSGWREETYKWFLFIGPKFNGIYLFIYLFTCWLDAITIAVGCRTHGLTYSSTFKTSQFHAVPDSPVLYQNGSTISTIC